MKFSSRDPFRGLANLRILILIACHFENTCTNIFQCLSNLEFLENNSPRNNSHINYSTSKRLRSLILTDVEPIDFTYQLGSHLIKLKYKLLYFNPDNFIDKITFKNLKQRNLRTLDLTENQLPEFDAIWIRELTNLKHLNLSNNLIRSIKFDYDFLNGLESLCLGNNRLELIDRQAFSKLYSLKLLDLSQNKLNLANPDIFLGLNNLECLYMNDVIDDDDETSSIEVSSTRRNLKLNEITRLLINSSHHNNLRELCLAKNKLLNINGTDFSEFKNLKFLDLSENKLDRLQDDMFSSLKFLETLNLYSNQIKSLDAKIFNGLENLKHLCLKRNPIAFLAPDVFESLEKLREVDLRQTCIFDDGKTCLNDFFKSRVHFLF